METKPAIKVHRVTIIRSPDGTTNSAHINSAKCRLCGVILERNEGPLVIGVPGLYAVIAADTETARFWRVDEPLHDGLVLCTAEPPRESVGLSASAPDKPVADSASA
jgi:hypothetical protein